MCSPTFYWFWRKEGHWQPFFLLCLSLSPLSSMPCVSDRGNLHDNYGILYLSYSFGYFCSSELIDALYIQWNYVSFLGYGFPKWGVPVYFQFSWGLWFGVSLDSDRIREWSTTMGYVHLIWKSLYNLSHYHCFRCESTFSFALFTL